MTTVKFLPVVLDVELYDNDGHTIEIECLDGNDAALNVSGYTWTSQWRRSRSAATGEVDLEVDVSDAAAGFLRVHFTAAIMVLLTSKVGVWDLQGQLSGADPVTPIGGKVTKVLDVTRP